MKASIVIPSYNAKERLYLNLMALNQQSYEGDDVEVIIVDNGSTDATYEMANNFPLKYPKRVLRIEKNQGIAFGRNTGIRVAKGDILIFHDSDMLAANDFVEKHLKAHENKDSIVCGISWKRMYTFFYDKFAPEQMEAIQQVYKDRDNAPDLFMLADKQQLIPDLQINETHYEDYVFDLDVDFVKGLKSILTEYGPDLAGYSLPWRFFITNNLSVARNKVLEVGLLDEGIQRYGFEDYDLGIRLYKAGCHFKIRQDIISVHQEHPVNYTHVDMVGNMNYICEKYNSIYFIDMILVCGGDMLLISDKQMNEINIDINKTLELEKFEGILTLYLDLLQLKRKKVLDPAGDNSMFLYTHVAKNIPILIQDICELMYRCNITVFTTHLCYLIKYLLQIDIEEIIYMNREQLKFYNYQ